MSANQGTYEVNVDESRNRLYLTLRGMIDVETTDDILAELQAGIDTVDDGFGLVNDISEFKPASQEAADAIEEGQQMLAEGGAGAIVRVVGDSVIGKMQFERRDRADNAYHVATAESREQADEFLNRFEDDRE